MNENIVCRELSKLTLGDERLNRRARKIVGSLSEDPQKSFAQAFSSEAHREAFYRFVRNPNVEWSEVFKSHLLSSIERGCQQEELLVLHDTTSFEFGPSTREDLGWVSYQGENFNSQGFFGHFALAVQSAQDRLPVGIVGFEPYRRLEPPRRKRKSRLDNTRESTRWGRMVKAVEEKLSQKTTAIHVMDREGDNYELLSQLYEEGSHFVIRLSHDRKLKSVDGCISDALNETPWICHREVKLSTRKKEKGDHRQKRFPERKKRIAKLGFRAASVEIKRSDKAPASMNRSLELNVVHAYEIDPKEGETPVDWKLFTTEPIKTEEDILKIVDIYRARWLIEEYFKALKTGCSYEKRQLESYQTLLNALALLIPIAWQLLLLRHLSRTYEKHLAQEYFTKSELFILSRKADYKMPDTPTIRDAFLAVAALGGHIKNNGDPGWLVLMRGFDKLLTLEIGYHLATERCDQ